MLKYVTQPKKKSKIEEVIQPVFCNDSEDEDYGEHPVINDIEESSSNIDGESSTQSDEDDEDEDELDQRMLYLKSELL
ncbi:hypothetical protein G6F56_013997 [Rhizopus delemar]|nr:hypothetical protein G6F56_013997 [Rhizopus delemar]